MRGTKVAYVHIYLIVYHLHIYELHDFRLSKLVVLDCSKTQYTIHCIKYNNDAFYTILTSILSNSC